VCKINRLRRSSKISNCIITELWLEEGADSIDTHKRVGSLLKGFHHPLYLVSHGKLTAHCELLLFVIALVKRLPYAPGADTSCTKTCMGCDVFGTDGLPSMFASLGHCCCPPSPTRGHIFQRGKEREGRGKDIVK
jgi:hypothetical protein